MTRRALVVVLLLLGLLIPASAPAAPEGQLTWAVHVSIAPTWFDPAETPGIITPYMFLYALHDAMLKPMPGNPQAPSLAESWSVSKDGLTYDFILRKGAKFHNGEPVTAEDVKFSYERYKGAAAKSLKDRVAGVETPDPGRVRFRLKAPWPDFLTFYTSATGAGWIVPKKYVEKIGDDGYKKSPVGAGPYEFVSFTPGIELVLEAFEAYWRKTPSIKRLVFRVVPEDTTRLAMLKRGEADIAYSVRGALAEELVRTPGLKLATLVLPANQWLVFTDQWDPKSPWSDHRVRLAANLAIDRKAINQAETLGHSRMTGSMIPQEFEFGWVAPLYPYDPAKAKQLLAEAGYPNGFDGGEYTSDVAYGSVGERRSPATGRSWAFACSSGRSSAWPSSPSTGRRSSGTSSRAAPPPSATPPPASRPSCTRRGFSPTEAIRTSTGSSTSRRRSWTGRSARRSCTRSSSWSTRRSCTRQSGSSGG